MPPRRQAGPKSDQSCNEGTSRNLRKIRPAPSPYSPGGMEPRGWEQKNKISDDVERRRKRRESDAKCRANLSSCFSSLRTQVQQRTEHQVKMSKEALLYSSIDQIQYLEAILVLLQQNQDISSGVTPSQPVEVLQGLHKEFISQRQGLNPEDLALQGDPGKMARNSCEKTAASTTKSTMIDVVSLNDEPSSLEAPQAATPKAASIAPERAMKPRKRARKLKAHKTTTRKSTGITPTDSELSDKVTSETIERSTIPTMILKKMDSIGASKTYYISTPSKLQRVPRTPERGEGMFHGSCTEFGVHQVPGTPIKPDRSASHYQIRGKDVTPSKSNAFDFCDDCQIEGSNALDLTCYENPDEWKEELMYTPQRGNPDDMMNFRTPTLKRKAPETPLLSAGKRSRKRLFTPDKKGKSSDLYVETLPPVRTYAKRATAARTRPWDAVAWKVTSPYQPYSGLHRQRKESRGEKARLSGGHRTKRTHRERQMKLMQAMGLTGGSANSGATIEHSEDTVSVSCRDTKITFETPSDENFQGNSQDSLSITEPPTLPQNIRNLISIEDSLPCDDSPQRSDVTLQSSNLGELLLDDEYYSPLEMYPDSLGEFPASCHSTLWDQDMVTFDLSPDDLCTNNPLTGDRQGGISVQVLSPERARLYHESAMTGRHGGLAGTPRRQDISGMSTSGMGTNKAGSGLDALIQGNVWKGARNQDITLTQLQTEPIFGNVTSVYESPQWTMTPLGQDQDKGVDWVDVGSTESATAGHDSWDTADFLSSIESGPGGLPDDYSSESQSSSGPSSVELEPGCAASRAIEEYQVVPHYRPEE